MAASSAKFGEDGVVTVFSTDWYVIESHKGPTVSKCRIAVDIPKELIAKIVARYNKEQAMKEPEAREFVKEAMDELDGN